MPIRMSGLISNLDTDSIIKELMKAQNMKKTKVENKITKVEWKQEKWKELNTKIYSLYTGSLNKMRLQGSFNTKKVTSSDETKVSVDASSNAVSGSHSIQVNKLASAQYITGSKVQTLENTAVSGTTKLVEIDSALGGSGSGEVKINFSTQEKSFSLTVTDKTTVNDFVNAAKQAGINASYDTSQKRFFLSGSNSGVENSFSITTTAVSTGEIEGKNAIRDLVGYEDLGSDGQTTVDNAIDQYKAMNKLLNQSGLTEAKEKEYQDKLKAAQDAINNYVQRKVTQDLRTAYTNNEVSTELTSQYGVRTYQEVVDQATTTYYDKLGEKEFKQEDLDAAIKKAVDLEATKYANAVKSDFVNNASSANPFTQATEEVGSALQDFVAIEATSPESVSTGGPNRLEKLGLSTIVAELDASGENVTYKTSGTNITLVQASNSEVVYNGAILVGTTNSIKANGLTFNIHAVTSNPVTLSVAKDTQGIYDSIKKLVKDYNEVLKEMNESYFADTSRGYQPLTDEQKEAMTEDQIEKWEKKIKDSLLRRDDRLGSLLTTMKNSLMTSVTHEGKSYSLTTFGISTSLYLEKGILHIDGDPDDSTSSAREDKLMKALEENPDAVMKTISTLVGNLYSDMTDKMKTTTLSSAMTFYNDKELKNNLKAHKSDLSDLESRLKKIEDRYYKQFTAMESAMAKLNSQTNSLASLMGTNG